MRKKVKSNKNSRQFIAYTHDIICKYKLLKCHTIILAFSEIVHMWIEYSKKLLHFKSIFYTRISLPSCLKDWQRGKKKTEWKMRIWDFYLIFSICCRDSSYRQKIAGHFEKDSCVEGNEKIFIQTLSAISFKLSSSEQNTKKYFRTLSSLC